MKPWYMASHRKDLSEPDIVQALKGAGFTVWDRLPCDLLTWRPDKGWQPLECKSPYNKNGTRKRRKDQQAQEEFILSTNTPIVLTPIEALRAVGAI